MRQSIIDAIKHSDITEFKDLNLAAEDIRTEVDVFIELRKTEVIPYQQFLIDCIISESRFHFNVNGPKNVNSIVMWIALLHIYYACTANLEELEKFFLLTTLNFKGEAGVRMYELHVACNVAYWIREHSDQELIKKIQTALGDKPQEETYPIIVQVAREHFNLPPSCPTEHHHEQTTERT